MKVPYTVKNKGMFPSAYIYRLVELINWWMGWNYLQLEVHLILKVPEAVVLTFCSSLPPNKCKLMALLLSFQALLRELVSFPTLFIKKKCYPVVYMKCFLLFNIEDTLHLMIKCFQESQVLVCAEFFPLWWSSSKMTPSWETVQAEV